MGVYENLFVGPYAEFAVPAGRAEEFPPQGEDEEPLCSEQLGVDWGLEPRHDDYYRYMPKGTGPPTLYREMFFSGKNLYLKGQDLTDLDLRAEMEWFAATFAEPLGQLAERFGTPPRIRWGLVFWFS